MSKRHILIFLLFTSFLFSARYRHVSPEWNTKAVNLQRGLFFSGDSWHYLSWFGVYYQTSDWWIYHSSKGWLYPESDGDMGVWFYCENFGSWIWVREDIYPFAWNNGIDSWINFCED
jgi:hypothetical protein